MSFGKNLKAAREKKQISQYELAELVGVNQAAIAYFELGSKVPNIFNGVKIAQVLGVTAEQLVNGQAEE